jgi:hypothetical protein
VRRRQPSASRSARSVRTPDRRTVSPLPSAPASRTLRAPLRRVEARSRDPDLNDDAQSRLRYPLTTAEPCPTARAVRWPAVAESHRCRSAGTSSRRHSGGLSRPSVEAHLCLRDAVPITKRPAGSPRTDGHRPGPTRPARAPQNCRGRRRRWTARHRPSRQPPRPPARWVTPRPMAVMAGRFITIPRDCGDRPACRRRAGHHRAATNITNSRSRQRAISMPGTRGSTTTTSTVGSSRISRAAPAGSMPCRSIGRDPSRRTAIRSSVFSVLSRASTQSGRRPGPSPASDGWRRPGRGVGWIRGLPHPPDDQ